MSAKLLHFSFSDIWANRLGIMWHGIRECKCSHVIRKCQTTRACLEQQEGQLYVTESTNVVNYV